MSELACEICVLGGGPAGSVAARRLAQLGHDVVLVDRSTRQPCIESLAPSLAPLLDTVGLLRPAETAAFCRERRALLKWGTGRVEEKVLPSPALLVDRARLDRLLRDAAADAGVRVVAGNARSPGRLPSGTWLVAVKTRAGMRSIGARFLVDARGRRGAFASGVDAPRTAAMSAGWADCGPPFGETRIESGLDEWFWGCPLPRRRYMATLFVEATRVAGLSRDSRTVLYRSLLSRSELLEGLLRGRMTGAVGVRDATPGAWRDPIGEDFIRIGDAAGAIDPLSSQGVQAAILSAVRGSAAVHTILVGPDPVPALRFYRDRQRDAMTHAGRNAARLYRTVAREKARPFWAARSRGAEGPAPGTGGEFAVGRPLPPCVEASPDLRIVTIPVLSGDLITSAPAIAHPGLGEPVAFLGGVAVAPLLDDLAPVSTTEQIMRGWGRRMRPETARSIMHWMHAAGVVVASPVRR